LGNKIGASAPGLSGKQREIITRAESGGALHFSLASRGQSRDRANFARADEVIKWYPYPRCQCRPDQPLSSADALALRAGNTFRKNKCL
jgi:hypothetical protein